MALTANQILRLRRIVDEQDSTTYTDEYLQAMADERQDDVTLIAADIWDEKAAAATSLVDVTEGPSSRRLSQVRSASLESARFWRARVDAQNAPAASGRGPARTRQIERA